MPTFRGPFSRFFGYVGMGGNESQSGYGSNRETSELVHYDRSASSSLTGDRELSNGARMQGAMEEGGRTPGAAPHQSRLHWCNLKRIAMVGAVLGLVGIVIVVVLVNQSSSDSLGSAMASTLTTGFSSANEITPDDFIHNVLFLSRRFNGTWISDTSFAYYSTVDEAVWEYDVVNGTGRVIIPTEHMVMDDWKAYAFTISPDRRYALIKYATSQIFRYSTLALYTIYDLVNSEIVGPLTPGGNIDPQDAYLSAAIWSPDGSTIAFVFDNNIYIRRGDTVVKITTTGVPGEIYNGIADWVYEEEVLGQSEAMSFSPDGSRLAFAQFIDSNVPTIKFPIYGWDPYPTIRRIHYPKVGQNNPKISLHVADLSALANGRRADMEILLPPPEINPSEHYYTQMYWVDPSRVQVTWMNRKQDKSYYSLCEAGNAWRCSTFKTYESQTGWAEQKTRSFFSGTSILYTLPTEYEGDAFDQILVQDIGSDKKWQVTTGAGTVSEIFGWDTDRQLVYYAARGPGTNASVAFLFEATTDPDRAPQPPRCLTCSLTYENPNTNVEGPERPPCAFATGTFSKSFSFFSLKCENSLVHFPEIRVVSTEDLRTMVVWDDNARSFEAVEDYEFPEKRVLSIPLDNFDGADARAVVYLPVDRVEGEKFPLVVETYAGPGDQRVTERSTGITWGDVLASSQKMVFAQIDGRGSGFRGKNLLHSVYRQLGGPEVQDQIEVTRKLLSHPEIGPWIDPHHVGIWGWSYGGFVSASALAEDDSGTITCGISVAPVTDWRLYDSIYTERYMLTEVENEKGYRNASLLQKEEKFRGKNFLLVHGNADDNVHYQQSMRLARNLEIKDVMFQQISYPDEAHGLGGVRTHLYHSMIQFWNRCFDRDDNENLVSSIDRKRKWRKG